MSVSLNSALSGLRAAQQALNTISTNIANASTVGYTRKLLPQETQIVDGTGGGVSVQSLIRNVDKTLIRDINKQASISSASTIAEKYLERIQDFHGASDAERSISAEMGRLADSFTALSSAPNSPLYLSDTVNAAQRMAGKFNEFSNLLNQMRNDTETEISANIGQVNFLLEKIAKLNNEVSYASSGNRSTADFEDQRDLAMKELSKYLQISSFTNEDNQLVVQTKQGQILADGVAHKIMFNKSNLTPSSYPGNGANNIYLDSFSTVPLQADVLGGSLGALLTLRDTTLPTYQAQLDEMAQKMAERFDKQGLKLFVDSAGNVPASVAPPAAVSYVGFSSNIRVNQSIINDPTLLRSGTYGASVAEGSSEVVSRIVNFAFGAYQSQQAASTVDISTGTIFASTGMTQYNRVIGTANINSYGDLDTAPNITAPATFSITVGATVTNVTINPGDTAATMVNNVNTAAGYNLMSLNGLGQIMLTADQNITITDTGIGGAGLSDLGLTPGTTVATNPSFTVQIGSQTPVTVSIAPGDTVTNLLTTLNTIPDLVATLNGSGGLVLTPAHGGAITIRNAVGTPIDSLGLSITNVAHTPFRDSNLGGSATLSTGILGNSTLEDFSRSMISDHAEDHGLAKDSMEKETAFLETLSNRFSNESGVDIDEELSNLIRIQTAYTAAARMIAKTEELFNELMQSFRL